MGAPARKNQQVSPQPPAGTPARPTPRPPQADGGAADPDTLKLRLDERPVSKYGNEDVDADADWRGASGLLSEMLRTSANPNATLVAAFLSHNPSRCPACWHSLVAAPKPVCPKCGTRLGLTLSAARTRVGAFPAGLVGLSFGLGFSAFQLALAGLPGLVDGNWEPFNNAPALELMAAAMLGAAALVAWLGSAAKIRSAPTSAALPLAGLCWVASLVQLALFAFVFK